MADLVSDAVENVQSAARNADHPSRQAFTALQEQWMLNWQGTDVEKFREFSNSLMPQLAASNKDLADGVTIAWAMKPSAVLSGPLRDPVPLQRADVNQDHSCVRLSDLDQFLKLCQPSSSFQDCAMASLFKDQVASFKTVDGMISQSQLEQRLAQLDANIRRAQAKQ